MSKMKVVVTGGAGFIGSHVVEALCDKGYEVVVIDDLSFGYKEFVDSRARFIEGRIQDKKILDEALPGAGAVVHLAASSIIAFSYENPLEYFENNVTAGVILLESMRKHKVKKMIFSSSAAVYGEPKSAPTPEDAAKEPMHPYGASKLAFENALTGYYHGFGIESVSLRYFNAYGPRDEQVPRTRAVPIWIKAIWEGKPVPLYWKGRQKRDYVYVSDVAEAHLAAFGLSGLHFINIGSGRGITMKDLLNTLEKLTGKRALVVEKGERLGDPPILVADISKAKRLMNWYPKVDFEEGLKKTISYYLEQFEKR